MTETLQPQTSTLTPRPPGVSAAQIASLLELPVPTEQQRRVIESPLAPALVIAGAGSGKTETMANRVLWLLANQLVTPAQILGLTFTRKAAGQLADRIGKRIRQLVDRGLLLEHDEFEQPTVSTYNSFANSIFRDNAVLLGRESDGAVLSEASAWQLVRSRVLGTDDSRLPDLEKNVDAVTKAVFELGAALSENVADPERVRRLALDFARVAELPAGSRGALDEAETLAQTVGALDVLLDLAEQVRAAKQKRGLIEYSDQVALALAVVTRFGKAREELQGRFRVVLLDEYQDTSVVQTRLLATIFRGQPVMAVGDPHQSIYGWRGASAANLDQFGADFVLLPALEPQAFGDRAAEGGAPMVQQFALSTSWRNGRRILDAANALVAPLTARTRVPVEQLEPSPAASDLPIELCFEEQLDDEARKVASWLSARLAEPRADGSPPTAALLLRTRKTLDRFLAELRRQHVPYHVLGVGGLLQEPEIADVVSALRVMHDPTAGSELVRLLAGSRWRIGAADLHALSSLASWLRDRNYAQQPLPDDVRQALRSSVAEGEDGSVVEALDFLGGAPAAHGMLARFSPAGLERLREAAATIAALRARAGLDLPDLLTVVAQELLLDIEVAANEARSAGMANFDALYDALGGYLAVEDVATLGGFLSWLREAEFRDDLSPRQEEPTAGTVQVLTIHGAKGLEWDIVAVPRMVTEELPARSKDGYNGWLRFGSLPYEFRGDAAELPEFNWRSATTRKELLSAKKDFAARVKERFLLEERRLAYVAVTRAKHSLLLSGSFWATQTAARGPSVFLAELAAAGVIGPLPEGPTHPENPDGGDAARFVWPLDPLGERRAAVERAAARVRDADPGSPGRWSEELDLLLAERQRLLAGSSALELPVRVAASRFKDYVTAPALVAAALRRPMPEKHYRATRLGTVFHSWVENRSSVSGATEEIDDADLDFGADGDLPLGDEEVDEQRRLVQLQQTFERSEWAELKPLEVEVEVHLPFEGHIVVCKIDAVYERDGRIEIVDWKTGKTPRDAEDLDLKQLQLALYRLAYARWKGIDPELIDAVFFYVAEDRIIRPERIYSESELRGLWSTVN